MKVKEATNQTKSILQEICKPTWNDEKNGVYIPLLDVVIDKTDLKEGADEKGKFRWNEAMEVVKNIGKRMPTIEEWQIIRYWKDEINYLLREHNGEEIDDFYWCCSEYGSVSAWLIHFDSGYTSDYGKCFTNRVRAVS